MNQSVSEEISLKICLDRVLDNIEVQDYTLWAVGLLPNLI